MSEVLESKELYNAYGELYNACSKNPTSGESASSIQRTVVYLCLSNILLDKHKNGLTSNDKSELRGLCVKIQSNLKQATNNVSRNADILRTVEISALRAVIK